MSHQSQQQCPIGKTACNRIHNITGTQVQNLIAKLDSISPFLPSHLPVQQLISETDYMPGEVNGGGGKHVLQECSILGHLRRIGAYSNETPEQSTDESIGRTTAIEIGAGTGRLSERLQRVTSDEMVHVMIDRQEFHPSQCRDIRMRKRANDSKTIQRVVIDVADLDLSDYCKQSTCFCMSKHLCGPASDLAIAALEHIVPSSSRPPFAFATCCHYLCTFDAFAGKQYWIKLGLTEEDFEVAVAVSQWYSLKRKNEVESNVESSTNRSEDNVYIDNQKMIENAINSDMVLAQKISSDLIPSDEFERTFTSENKSKLGERVKLLFDMLRVTKLQELDYKAELVLYTNRSIENRLLVGTPST